MSFLRLRLRLLQHLGCAQSRYLCDRVTKHCGEDVVGVGAKARAGTGHLAFPSDSPRDASVNLLPRFRMWQLGEKAARLEVPIADEVHSAQTGKSCHFSVLQQFGNFPSIMLLRPSADDEEENVARPAQTLGYLFGPDATATY